MNIYKAGTKLFCDFHFGGKPRAKCVAVITPGNGRDSSGKVQVQLTETVGAYRKGEVLTLPTWQAVPCKQEKKLSPGQFFRRVNTDYRWE